MSRAVGAIIGFLFSGALAFMVVFIVCSKADNPDVVMYGPIYWGGPIGMVAGIIGGVIGAVFGAGGGWGENNFHRSPQDKMTCRKCGRQVPVGYRTCKYCGGGLK